MPITKSAKKALRQSKRRAIRNLKQKNAYQDAMKHIRKLLAEKQVGEAEKLVPTAYRALDKAAKTHVLHHAAAARKKSQIMAWIKKTKPAS